MIQFSTLLTCSLLMTCANISAQLFLEVSNQSGLTYSYPGISSFSQVEGGTCILDFNNDGFEDIYQSGGQFEGKLWKNNGDGTFSDYSNISGLNNMALEVETTKDPIYCGVRI
jgi:enediyne biosynthesis protein E4